MIYQFRDSAGQRWQFCWACCSLSKVQTKGQLELPFGEHKEKCDAFQSNFERLWQ